MKPVSGNVVSILFVGKDVPEVRLVAYELLKLEAPEDRIEAITGLLAQNFQRAVGEIAEAVISATFASFESEIVHKVNFLESLGRLSVTSSHSRERSCCEAIKFGAGLCTMIHASTPELQKACAHLLQSGLYVLSSDFDEFYRISTEAVKENVSRRIAACIKTNAHNLGRIVLELKYERDEPTAGPDNLLGIFITEAAHKLLNRLPLDEQLKTLKTL